MKDDSPPCGHERTYFDRTLDEHGNMAMRCADCGRNMDPSPAPRAEGGEAVTDEMVEAACHAYWCVNNGLRSEEIEEHQRVDMRDAIAAALAKAGGKP